MSRSLFILALALTLLCRTAVADGLPAGLNTFFGQYCVSCHGPSKQKGDFRIDTLGTAQTAEDAEYWQLVLDNLHLGEMPPPDHDPHPSIAEIEPVTNWIGAELKRARLALKGDAGEVVLRRLNKAEYRHTIEDLFDVRGNFTAAFPEDAVDHGFNNNGAVLMLSAAQIDAYLEAADFVLARAIAPATRPETVSATFTLHQLNDISRKNTQRDLENRLKKFDTLTPSEQEGTRRMQKEVESNPSYGRLFPVWTGQELRGALPDEPANVDGVLAREYGDFTSTRQAFHVKMAGWYRFSFDAYALKSEGKPVRLKIEYGNFSQNPEILDILGVQEGIPQTATYEVYLQPYDQIVFNLIDGKYGDPKDIPSMPGPFIAIRSATMEGPIFKEWPPKGHRILFGDVDPADPTPEKVAQIVAHFAPRLFRRSVNDRTVRKYTELYEHFTETLSPDEALKTTLKTMMVAPQFLYQLEPPDRLDPYSLASRLSYFLWRSMPDDQLLRLAASGQLSNPATLREEVDRMLADPRSGRFLEDFTGQWLRTQEVGIMRPNKYLYPEYDEELEKAMIAETQGFMQEMFANDLPLSNLIDSDWAILNERLARHYKIPGVEGSQFRKVALDKSQTIRGGLLTQASILAVTSNGSTTSPVIRGVWVLNQFLGTPAPPPPPNVPAIEPDIRGATNIKEQLAKHRDIPQCAACHAKIDPFGVALENFDVIGGWRETYRALEPIEGTPQSKLVDGKPVLSNDTLPNVGPFKDFQQFRRTLLNYQFLVQRSLAEKLATFALGRSLNFSDREDIEGIVRQTNQANGGMKTMVRALIQSPLFQNP